MNDLLAENRTLKRKLTILTSAARKNEEKMQRYQAHELRLLSASSVTELIHMLLNETRQALGLSTVTLTLLDADHEIRRLLDQHDPNPTRIPELQIIEEPGTLQPLFRTGFWPRLGAFDSTLHTPLFLGVTPRPASTALLPLVSNDELIGSLNFGSGDPNRFLAEFGTVFLEHLAAIVAVSLKNAVNQEKLKRTGLTDPLTGINNRRFFDQRLPEEITRSNRSGKPLSCLFLDVDHFKRVNDDYDHRTGDQVLCAVAATIKAQLRTSDVLSRYGGEEFTILLPNTTPQAAVAIAERIRTSVELGPISTDMNKALRVTLSAGLSTCTGVAQEQEVDMVAASLVKKADQALLSAKENGRNRVVAALP